MGMIQFNERETPNFYATLTDGATNQYPRAYVYNYDKTLKETVNLTHNANGQYIGTASASYLQGTYSVVYKVFSDSGHTTLNTDYWIEEDVLFVNYLPNFGGVGGGSSNIVIDIKKLAEAVWDHPFPKKLMEIVESIKTQLKKVQDSLKFKELSQLVKTSTTSVLGLIKKIEIPEMPEIPEPKEVDLEPIIDKLNTIISEIKLIPTEEPKDYENELNEIKKLIENIPTNEYSLEIYNILERLKNHEESVSLSLWAVNSLEEIKKLLNK